MKNKYLVLLTSCMAVFLCVIISIYSLSNTSRVDLYDDSYIEKYFDKDKVMEVNLEISEDDLNDMNENATKEEFKLGSVSVNDSTYNNVGIRTKGNSSLSSVANSDSDRYSYKIQFDKYTSGQSMDGLTTLNLNNNYSDASYMREFITYSICKDMGLATPEFAFAKVSINGEYHGLYLAVEDIGDSFLENNYDDTTGELYKSEERASLVYQNDDSESYSNLKYMGDKKNNSWTNVTKLLKSLKTGDDIEKYLDVDSVLKNIAISTALLNMDSYQGNFAHNYYLYEQDGKFTMIPWDFNMSFGGFGGSDSIKIDEPTTGSMDDRPLISTLLKNSEYKEKYHEYLNTIVTKYMDSDYIKNMITETDKLIGSYVKDDPTAFYTYEEYKKSISLTVDESSDKVDNTEKAEIKDKIESAQKSNDSVDNVTSSESKSTEKKNEISKEKTDIAKNKSGTENSNTDKSNNKGMKNMGSGKSIMSVVKNMSETIKSQLSGETTSVKDEAQKSAENSQQSNMQKTDDTNNESNTGKGGEDLREGNNNFPGGDEPPEDMKEMPAFAGNQDGNFTPPEMPDGNTENSEVENKSNTDKSTDGNNNQKIDRQRPSGDKKAMENMGKSGEHNSTNSATSKQNLIISVISLICMAVSLMFAKLFKKRRTIK